MINQSTLNNYRSSERFIKNSSLELSHRGQGYSNQLSLSDLSNSYKMKFSSCFQFINDWMIYFKYNFMKGTEFKYSFEKV